jgi:hypothetical protein
MDRRRKNKLYFNYRLPEYIASSHRKGRAPGKKKQLNTIGRGGYNNHLLPKRELYIIETGDMTIQANLRRGRQLAQLSKKKLEE